MPFPGIPYGLAPAWCFPCAEFGVFALFLLCLLHAVTRYRGGIAYLLGGFVFGALLEYFEVATDSYVYGHFRLMLGVAPHDLPLWVAAAWGVIMYAARLFSDSLGLPLFAAAALDTLLALNIDLSIDVVAHRLHMWTWPWKNIQFALTGQWFGIPYANFVGWATVVFCYSAFSRLFERMLARISARPLARRAALAAPLVALLAILASLAVLVFTESIFFPILIRLGIHAGIRLAVIVLALIGTVALGWPRRHPSGAPLAAVSLTVPAWFHIFFVGCFFGLGFYRENAWMTAAAIANLLIGIALHLYPGRSRANASPDLLPLHQES